LWGGRKKCRGAGRNCQTVKAHTNLDLEEEWPKILEKG